MFVVKNDLQDKVHKASHSAHHEKWLNLWKYILAHKIQLFFFEWN